MVFGTFSSYFFTHFFSAPTVEQNIFYPAHGFLSLLCLLWGCDIFSCFPPLHLLSIPFPPASIHVSLAEKSRWELNCAARRLWGGVGEHFICRFLSGLFPPACSCSVIHLSQLQDLKPAIHLTDFRNFTALQLDWCMTPCSAVLEMFLDGSQSLSQFHFQFLMVNSTH